MDIRPNACRPWSRILFCAAVCIGPTLCYPHRAQAAIGLLRFGRANTQSCNEPAIEWQSNYKAAYAEAKCKKRMLLVNFVPRDDHPAQRQLDEAVEQDSTIQRRLRSMVLVRLPVDYQSKTRDDAGRLVDHPAFKYLSGKTGVAIIDLQHRGTPHYGKVVTALPFSRGKYYRWRIGQFKEALDLPPGTITQRTMIWAVRIHPEAPASTEGRCSDALAEAAEHHSEYQARIGVQGHQRWETRFHKVRSAARANQASEVVAESWPNQNLIDSCIDCVASWRHSPGHWRAVRGRHRLFGYDIRRGRNGIWYGTGIFAN